MKSFVTDNIYYDNKNYPRGFSRYGNFTIREAQLLERFGHAYYDLYIGKRQPITDEEKQFVAVCNGQCEPSNEHEKVWRKYIQHISKPKRFHTLSGGKPPLDIVVEDYIEIENEYLGLE